MEGSTLKDRGTKMLERTSKILTLVSIEYNLDTSTKEFNILEGSMQLFQLMSQEDNYMQILTGNREKVLWEINTPLPEGSQFAELFRLREQTFRKGHKKATIYCTIEGSQTINRLKFREPLKSYLRQQNIWIKPDLYATKVVSSPGFLTLVHPRITNKTELTAERQSQLSQTRIDETDEVVKKWKQSKLLFSDDYRTPTPNFHLETSLRKWGEIQVEVIKGSKYSEYFATYGY